MLETKQELDDLQDLLDRSHASATGHLRSIIHDDRVLKANDVVGLLPGMKVVSIATVTAKGEPRVSAVDGHFLHAHWFFSTGGDSAKARHLERRPTVSVAHIDGEDMAVFCHGTARRLQSGDDDWDWLLAHLTAHYESSPLSWGPDVRLYRCDPTWMVGYAFRRAELLAARGLPG